MFPPPAPAPFHSAHTRAGIVKILFVINAVVIGSWLLADAVSLAFPPVSEEQDVPGNPIGALLIFIISMIALLNLVLYLTTAVFFLVWLHRAYSNLRSFNDWSRPDYTPGWAVGSFFVPFVNLVVPYRAVKEVWQKSTPPDEAMLSEPSPPATFPLWWMFWIVSSIVNNAATRLSGDLPQATVTILSIIGSALAILAAIFAYAVVDEIDRKQEETRGKLKLGAIPGPPPPPADLMMSNGVAPTP